MVRSYRKSARSLRKHADVSWALEIAGLDDYQAGLEYDIYREDKARARQARMAAQLESERVQREAQAAAQAESERFQAALDKYACDALRTHIEQMGVMGVTNGFAALKSRTPPLQALVGRRAGMFTLKEYITKHEDIFVWNADESGGCNHSVTLRL